jgi:hypothetical protein
MVCVYPNGMPKMIQSQLSRQHRRKAIFPRLHVWRRPPIFETITGTHIGSCKSSRKRDDLLWGVRSHSEPLKSARIVQICHSAVL